MMTRSHVARRLGKSIATVRRMEGTELHPKVDDRGVNRFDPNEVERLAAGGIGPNRRRPNSTSNYPLDSAVGEEATEMLESDLESVRRAAIEYKQALEIELERAYLRQGTIERLEEQNRELRGALRVCASLALDSLDQEQLSDLGEDGIEALEHMIQLCD